MSKPPKPECLILGNGPSLIVHPLQRVPRDRVWVMGVNQSWRVYPNADAHVVIDHDQFELMKKDPLEGREAVAAAYYARLSKAGTLYHTGSGTAFGLGRKMDRHDELTFGRNPLQKRHRGAGHPQPPPEKDGGVALKAGYDTGGSSAYVALQVAAAMGFDRIWFVGLDGTSGTNVAKHEKPQKFTGKPSNCERHDRMWRLVPADVKAKLGVIGPSSYETLPIVAWPWGIPSC